jgi:ubiquitin-activating enzyme E1
MGVEAVAK